jgi:hypothetical protein
MYMALSSTTDAGSGKYTHQNEERRMQNTLFSLCHGERGVSYILGEKEKNHRNQIRRQEVYIPQILSTSTSRLKLMYMLAMPQALTIC